MRTTIIFATNWLYRMYYLIPASRRLLGVLHPKIDCKTEGIQTTLDFWTIYKHVLEAIFVTLTQKIVQNWAVKFI